MSGAHNIGTVALIEAGAEVWSSQRRDAGDDPVGGVVIASESVVIDEDEGTTERAYLCIDPYNSRPAITFHRLRESEIAPDSVTTTSPSRLTLLVRRLCEEVAFVGKGRARKGLLTTDQADYVTYAQRLVAVLMGGSR